MWIKSFFKIKIEIISIQAMNNAYPNENKMAIISIHAMRSFNDDLIIGRVH